MRSGTTRYPVDRYLDKSSKKFEMVNIIDDDIWNPEPALRPEDEMMLRKLHEMLQSTADDLKLLSGELAKYHEPGVVYKTPPTPLDEEFNAKVHIEEVVNAKFHGHKVIDKPNNIPIIPETHKIYGAVVESKYQKAKPLNTDLENQISSVNKKPTARTLTFSRTRIMQIKEKKEDNLKSEKLNNGKVLNNAPAVGYNEYCFTYDEPKVIDSSRKILQVQDMPCINIRSELKQQNVLQLDIFPEKKENIDQSVFKSNVAVVNVQHETESKQSITREKKPAPSLQQGNIKESSNPIPPVRKVSKMSTCDSSGSTNNVSSDTKANLVKQKRIVSTIINSPNNSARNRAKKAQNRIEIEKRQRANLDEWKRKLNIVYGASSKKETKTNRSKSKLKKSIPLNNTEYIPYSKLTVGGVRASDIEKEISDLPNKNNVPLSPILDKILNSRENSFHQDTPRKSKESPRILTTSDENLLQEVINIERSVSDTLSKNIKIVTDKPIQIPSLRKENSDKNNSEDSDSYADDFEDDKSEHSGKATYKSRSEGNLSEQNINKDSSEASSENESSSGRAPNAPKDKNVTYTKTGNLSFKDSVDVFEFVHSVDTQDTATQSNVTEKKYPQGTQTSPLTSQTPTNIQPIHNDLWPSIDPRQEVEKMFALEKDFIKKLIIDEYSDLLEKSINKPSTSNENQHDDGKKNVTALQKNTQTSPARVKSVMTSPQRTKTRTTSPMMLTVPVDKNTSPMIVVTNEESHLTNVKSDADDISVNLSSPRFSLKLPQTSREVLSNIAKKSPSPSKISLKLDKLKKTFRKTTISSSSSIDADNSSSELSSLGEIKIKRKFRRRIPSLSDCSSSSTVSKYSYDLQTISILPLKSEGEVSLKRLTRKTGKSRPSEGETSFGPK